MPFPFTFPFYFDPWIQPKVLGPVAFAVEVAFTSLPTATPVWTDVTPYVRGLAIRRGRQHELARVETGTLDMVLDNRDRRFDPTYTAGPYYGYVVPMRKIRVKLALHDTVAYRFTGFVQGWPLSYPGRGKDALVNVRAVDGMGVLALKELNVALGQQYGGPRIEAVLDTVSWTTGAAWVLDSATNSQLGTTTVVGPVGDRQVDQGASLIQAATLSKTNALQHIQDVVDTEQGMFLVSGDGLATFHFRHRRNLPPYNTSQATFGDLSGELPYTDLIFGYDDTEIKNEVRLTRTGGSEQVATDATSQLAYWPHTCEKSGLLHVNDGEVLDMANYLLSRYKDPALRVKKMELKPVASESLWTQVMSREIGDRITVRRRPPGGGTLIEKQCYIEAVEDDCAVGDTWITRWQLSNADVMYWVLEDPTYGVLGTTTRLAY